MTELFSQRARIQESDAPISPTITVIGRGEKQIKIRVSNVPVQEFYTTVERLQRQAIAHFETTRRVPTSQKRMLIEVAVSAKVAIYCPRNTGKKAQIDWNSPPFYVDDSSIGCWPPNTKGAELSFFQRVVDDLRVEILELCTNSENFVNFDRNIPSLLFHFTLLD